MGGTVTIVAVKELGDMVGEVMGPDVVGLKVEENEGHADGVAVDATVC